MLPIGEYFTSFLGRQFHDVGAAERNTTQESHDLSYTVLFFARIKLVLSLFYCVLLILIEVMKNVSSKPK